MARASAKPAAEPIANPDAQAARALLLWLREQRIAIDAVHVGAVRIEGVRDLALQRSEGDAKPKGDRERKATMYERYAGPLAAAAQVPAQAESAVTEADDEDD